MSIKDQIAEFVSSLEGQPGVLPFLYNANKSKFDKTKDWVFYSGPVWTIDEPVAAIKTFLTGKWLTSGESVARFEHEFSKQNNFTHSLMVNSGSSANLIMITTLKHYFKWPDQSEIIVSCVGFPTTVAPIVQNNLTAKFVDIELDSLNFDLDLVEAAITAKTKAIFISPVLGNPPDMDRLLDIAERHNLMLVLDGCDSLGSEWNGKHLSDYAFTTSCSFYPAHHITTGEGGMVSARDEDFIKMARSFAWWGRDCYCVGVANLTSTGTCKKRFCKWLDGYDGVIDHKYLFVNIGYNLKPLDLQGALGLAQLKKAPEIHRLRRDLKEKIGQMFKKNLRPGAVSIPEELPKATTSWFGVPLICKNNTIKTALVEHLEKNRIQTRNYFAGNILIHPGYKGLDDYRKYPNANTVLDHVFFIGNHPSYTEAHLEYINEVIAKFTHE